MQEFIFHCAGIRHRSYEHLLEAELMETPRLCCTVNAGAAALELLRWATDIGEARAVGRGNGLY